MMLILQKNADVRGSENSHKGRGLVKSAGRGLVGKCGRLQNFKNCQNDENLLEKIYANFKNKGSFTYYVISPRGEEVSE